MMWAMSRGHGSEDGRSAEVAPIAAGCSPGEAGSLPVGVAFLLTQLGAYAAERFAARMATVGLTPPEAGLLRAIALTPGQSQQALARYLRTQPSRVVAWVDDLEGRGLVERRRNSEDRRLNALHLTADGQAALQRIRQVAAAHEDELCAPLDEPARQQLKEGLQRLRAHHGLAEGVHPGFRQLGPPSPRRTGPARG
jgi:DNA-binding MarR family transcriptional regulator